MTDAARKIFRLAAEAVGIIFKYSASGSRGIDDDIGCLLTVFIPCEVVQHVYVGMCNRFKEAAFHAFGDGMRVEEKLFRRGKRPVNIGISALCVFIKMFSQQQLIKFTCGQKLFIIFLIFRKILNFQSFP